jgi:Mg2+ transporter MgtE
MIYFSQLIGIRVVDQDGTPLGRVHDIGVDMLRRLPPSRALYVASVKRGRKKVYRIPWENVEAIDHRKALRVKRKPDAGPDSQEGPSELLMGKSLLDRQIVDLNGRRLVRVNDLCLAEFDQSLVLTGVDVSGAALLRRLGMGRASERLLSRLGFQTERHTISWEYVAPIDIQPEGIKLRIARGQMKTLHPADIADILEQLDPEARSRVIDILDNMTAAESISEVEPPQQADIISGLNEVRASDILEIMPPDEATDILGKLPRQKAERLLNIMGVEEAFIIRKLLGYEEHTAGGRMTTEFISISSKMTAQEVIERLRELAPEAETIYYLYVVDDENRLKGVVSLRDLLTNRPQVPIEEIMERDVISVNVGDDQESVADLMNKYDFLALPVVDDHNELLGIITVDDMIDVLREESREDITQISGLGEDAVGIRGALLGQLPTMALMVCGAAAAAALLYAFRSTMREVIFVAFFLPVLLRGMGDMGTISQTVVIDAVGGKDMSAREGMDIVLRELGIASIMGLMLSAACLIASLAWGASVRLGLAAAGSVLFSLAASVTAATLFGLMFGSMRNRPFMRLEGKLVSVTALVICLFFYLAMTSLAS